MDYRLCDELVQEIFKRLPSSSFPSVSLVSRRWLLLLRASTTSLSIRAPDPNSASSILSHFPLLSSLTVISNPTDEIDSNSLLLLVAASPSSRRLSRLRFLPAVPVSPSALLSSSHSFTHLTDLHLPYLPSFHWLSSFPSLKSLSLLRSPSSPSIQEQEQESPLLDDANTSQVLPLETLSISGIRAADRGASWLWRRCGNLRRLQLRGCEGTGDGPSSPSFSDCLRGIHVLELRSCRTIADRVLLLAADHCRSLESLLLYDGGSRDALRHFIAHSGAAGLRTLDLRLPLDLDNDHLTAIADGGRSNISFLLLASLRLQSCCLVTGEGLRALARAPAGAAIEELALVNCDVVEREPGLLTYLGQHMRRLRRLDLSHNETLVDKEVGAMLASCSNLVEIRLQGCRGLTDATLFALVKSCGKSLEAVDISRCPGITRAGVESFIMNTPRLNWIMVE